MSAACLRLLGSIFFAVLAVGCTTFRPMPVANPMFVSAQDCETLWERSVDVLHVYQFPIDRENKLDGIIETHYKIGSGVLEPWQHDSATAADRWESSLQTIRRRATVNFTPVQGGYLVGVEVLKELEDPEHLIINSAGYATFREATPLQRDLEVVVGPSIPEGWILIGRDPHLEQSMLQSLQQAFVTP